VEKKMKALIVEDDFISRTLLQRYLSPISECHVAVNGREAVKAYTAAIEQGAPYDLVCLDIMMPVLSGHAALKEIRAIEQANGVAVTNGVKVIMTTALSDSQSVLEAFREGCEAYVVKPIAKEDLIKQLRKLNLIPEE
jgi:two-component system, chemotaxis family, chemotaxis protein CheY